MTIICRNLRMRRIAALAGSTADARHDIPFHLMRQPVDHILTAGFLRQRATIDHGG